MTSILSPLPVIWWLRQDLRLADNPALCHAVAGGAPVIPVFILDDRAAGHWAMGGAFRVGLHHALESLRLSGVPLVCRQGDSEKILQEIAAATGARAVFWNRRYEPAGIAQDKKIKESLRASGIEAHSFNGRLLHEPWEIMNGKGEPYRVFTPYWKAAAARVVTPAVAPPERIDWYAEKIRNDALTLLPSRPDWSGGITAAWDFSENGARARLQKFLQGGVDGYAEHRDFPGQDMTSLMSTFLALGLISPRQIYHAAQDHVPFTRQLFWREFSYHLLYHFPHTDLQPLNQKFAAFPWQPDAEALAAWQAGKTGYPLVDAGMRQLWRTGWMHNRVRMVVASFLVKHLLQPWQEGAQWFWDTLVDADLANNTMGWQWTAGCGADAAPYFRIFNPMMQSEKFDAADYIRLFVPELAKLPDKYIHAPWTAPPEMLAAANIRLGSTYPQPIVEHGFARHRALEALKEI